jgi:hypothetical protein
VAYVKLVFNCYRESITDNGVLGESDEGVVALKSGNADGAKTLWSMFVFNSERRTAWKIFTLRKRKY